MLLKSINRRETFCRGALWFQQRSIFSLLSTSVVFLARSDGPRYAVFLSGILIELCWWKKKVYKEHAVQNNICLWCGRNRKLHKQFGNYRFIPTGVKSYGPFLTLNYLLVPSCAGAKYLVSVHVSLTSPAQDWTLKNASREQHWAGLWWIPLRAILYVYM